MDIFNDYVEAEYSGRPGGFTIECLLDSLIEFFKRSPTTTATTTTTTC